MTITVTASLIHSYLENATLVTFMAVIKERIRQLSNLPDENTIIESMQVSHKVQTYFQHGTADISKTEVAALQYENSIKEEIKEQSTELDYLSEKMTAVHDLIMLHDAIIKGLTENEQWFVEQYYDQRESLDSLVAMLSRKGKYLSKSILRRRKLQII